MEESHGTVSPNLVGAFFDVDQTLVRGASSYWAAKEMFRRSLFGFKEIFYAARQTFRYILVGEQDPEAVGDLTARAAQIVAGNSVEDMRRLGEEIYEKHFVPRVYRTTYQLLKDHVETGHTVYLISATPWLIAEEFARRIGAAGGIGTKTKVRNGRLVGELDGKIVHGQAKAEAVSEVADELGLDLEQSWAYSDSANDIPMLSVVGHPVAVNPDRELRRYAREQGWQIIRAYETKDLVKRYALNGALIAAAGGLAYLMISGGTRRTRRFLRSR